MAKRMDMPRILACAIGMAGMSGIPSGIAQIPASQASPAAPAAPYVYVPRAHLVGVERAFVGATTASVPGAGIRAFGQPDELVAGSERFEVRWYANPPGLPPGVVVLFETVHERQATVKNHVLRIAQKSEGHVRSTIEIPADEIRRSGRVREWRVSIVWRGRALATLTSANWDG